MNMAANRNRIRITVAFSLKHGQSFDQTSYCPCRNCCCLDAGTKQQRSACCRGYRAKSTAVFKVGDSVAGDLQKARIMRRIVYRFSYALPEAIFSRNAS